MKAVYAAPNAWLAKLLFYPYAALYCCLVWCCGRRLVGAAFLFYFLPLFPASILTPGILPSGKDKLRGNTPSLPTSASRFLIDAESGKKQTRTARGTAQGAMPLPIPRQSIPAPTGLGIYCLF